MICVHDYTYFHVDRKYVLSVSSCVSLKDEFDKIIQKNVIFCALNTFYCDKYGFSDSDTKGKECARIML